jgi:hypothetical protein
MKNDCILLDEPAPAPSRPAPRTPTRLKTADATESDYYSEERHDTFGPRADRCVHRRSVERTRMNKRAVTANATRPLALATTDAIAFRLYPGT